MLETSAGDPRSRPVGRVQGGHAANAELPRVTDEWPALPAGGKPRPARAHSSRRAGGAPAVPAGSTYTLPPTAEPTQWLSVLGMVYRGRARSRSTGRPTPKWRRQVERQRRRFTVHGPPTPSCFLPRDGLLPAPADVTVVVDRSTHECSANPTKAQRKSIPRPRGRQLPPFAIFTPSPSAAGPRRSSLAAGVCSRGQHPKQRKRDIVGRNHFQGGVCD